MKKILIALTAIILFSTAHSSELDIAIKKGLKSLSKQQLQDGSFGSSMAKDAIAGMAFLSGGHTPVSGLYKNESKKILNYLLSKQNKQTGGFDDGNSMYSHGFVTLYLAEVYGMSEDKKVLSALKAAISLIFHSQNSEGGWRYSSIPKDADISVTVCQINAIRAAYNVGAVGDEGKKVVTKAIAYVKNCHIKDGIFAYMAKNKSTFAKAGISNISRTAAGAMSLIGAGEYSSSNVILKDSMAFLRKYTILHLNTGKGSHFWYGQYYSAQALYHSWLKSDWEKYHNAAEKKILGLQSKDGSWHKPDSNGTTYNTAMALIILQIPNSYLPIFQR